MFLDPFSCEFEESECRFEITSTAEASNFIWKRRNPNEIESEAIPGPSLDHSENSNSFNLFKSIY